MYCGNNIKRYVLYNYRYIYLRLYPGSSIGEGGSVRQGAFTRKRRLHIVGCLLGLFIRRISVASNAIQTIDNEMIHLERASAFSDSPCR